MENQTEKLSIEDEVRVEEQPDFEGEKSNTSQEMSEDQREEVKEEVVEECLLQPKEEQIKSILVSYPSEVESMFGSTMIYKVVVQRESGNVDLFRRYSEFYELRKALISRYPCVFILPVHKRQLIGNKSRSFLLQRVYELNTFVTYLIHRDFLAKSELVQAFFSKQDFKQVAILLKKAERPCAEDLHKSYSLIFGHLKEKDEFGEGADVKHSKIEKFKQKVETNIEFFYRLKNCVEGFSSKRRELKTQEEENQIYEMILITYSNQTERYEELKKSFAKMTAYDNDSQWSLFAHKIEMLIRELEFFYEMVNQIRHYENQFVGNEEKKKQHKNKLAELGKGEKETVGFFKRQNRREVIQKYQDLLFETEQKSVFWKELLQLIYNVVILSELTIFKERKKERYSEILTDFGCMKKDNLKDYHDFWSTIISPNPK